MRSAARAFGPALATAFGPALVTALVTVLATVLVLAGCTSVTTGSASPAPATVGGADAVLVEQTSRDYYQALIARDFGKACGYNAPETTQKLLEFVREHNVSATNCAAALRKIYATPGAANAAAASDKFLKTARVQDVTVTGTTASITWSGAQDGAPQTVTNRMRKIDGQWKLVDVD